MGLDRPTFLENCLSQPQFDYIIVGAGAAGCVLAGRLTEDPDIRVLLIEAGADAPPGKEHPSILDPFPLSLNYPQFSWPYLTAQLTANSGNGSSHFHPYQQGRGVGGGSNILGMLAVRGFPGDYDEWREAGAMGWAWDDVLPYFRRLENDLDFAGPLHGRDGPIPVRRLEQAQWAPFSKAVGEVLLERGYPLVEDINADFRSGLGRLPMSNLPNQRISASMGYLDQAVRQRRNLVILVNTHVERINSEGRKAIGVTAMTTDGRKTFAAHETIISGGALYSPTVLMRSGIGPGKHLQEHGIEVVCDLAGVGQHLMNHPTLRLATHLRRDAIQDPVHRGVAQNCLRFSSGFEGCVENDMFLLSFNKTSWHSLGRRIGSIGVGPYKAYSSGQVRLRSADPAIEPEVKFNLLSDRRDLERLIIGLKLCLEILSDKRVTALRNEVFLPKNKSVRSLGRHNAWNWLRASVISSVFDAPAPIRRVLLGHSMLDPEAVARDPVALRQIVQQEADCSHHVCGTCRMGSPDGLGVVVDPDCRVLGMQGLRVVDASIMPTIVRANTHLPVLMIAEKMADVIRNGAH